GTVNVHAMAFDGAGNLYAGGDNFIKRWGGTSWTALPTTGSTNGIVRAVVVDGAGKPYVGGSFTTIGGTAAKGVAHWNGTSWDALPGLAGPTFPNNPDVHALALDGAGKLYAGGVFTDTGGSYIARRNGASWEPFGNGTGGEVDALAFDAGGNLWAGGSISTAGGFSGKSSAAWDGTNWAAL